MKIKTAKPSVSIEVMLKNRQKHRVKVISQICQQWVPNCRLFYLTVPKVKKMP